MPNRSKQKGTRYESELVKQAEAIGLEAKRAWGSNGEAFGLHSEVDCLVDGWKIQAKRRAKLPAYLKPHKEVDVTVFREDHGESRVMLLWLDWLDFLKERRLDKLELDRRAQGWRLEREARRLDQLEIKRLEARHREDDARHQARHREDQLKIKRLEEKLQELLP